MTAGRPAGADLEHRCMVRVADEDVTGCNSLSLVLRMASQAQVWIVVHEQLLVDGAVRVMANRATLAQGLVFEDNGPSLRLVTSGATFILPRHGQAALRLEDIAAVRIMAIHTIHETFRDGMMLRQIKFGLHVQMALETGGGIFAGIDNESSIAAGPDMFAAGAVAGFTTSLPRHGRILNIQPRMRARGKFADYFRMAIRAGLVADVMRARNLERRHDRG